MSNVERILGRLEEFKLQTQRDLSEIKKDLKSINQFRWKVVGAASAISFLTTIAIQLFFNK